MVNDQQANQSHKSVSMWRVRMPEALKWHQAYSQTRRSWGKHNQLEQESHLERSTSLESLESSSPSQELVPAALSGMLMCDAWL